MARFLLSLSILLGLSSAFAGESQFRVSLPQATWLAEESSPDHLVYRRENSKLHERVVAAAFDTTSSEIQHQTELTDKQKELSEARARVFRRLGLGNYEILDVDLERARHAVLVHASYLAADGQQVQVIERQFVRGSKLLVVTYVFDGAALNDRAAASRILDQVQPVAVRGRQPASAAELVGGGLTRAAVSGIGQSDALAPSSVRDLDMSRPENVDQCKDVEPSRRRGPYDESFVGTVHSSIASPGNCLLGAIDNVWGLLQGVVDLAWTGLKYTFSSTFREQVNAGVGALVAEAKKDKTAFGKRIASELWNATAKHVGVFFSCLRPQEQVRSICNMLTNFVPMGLVAKLVTRAPMTVAEAAQFAAQAKKAVGFREGAKAGIDEPSKKVLRPDGSREYAFENGITATVSDGAPAKALATAPEGAPGRAMTAPVGTGVASEMRGRAGTASAPSAPLALPAPKPGPEDLKPVKFSSAAAERLSAPKTDYPRPTYVIPETVKGAAEAADEIASRAFAPRTREELQAFLKSADYKDGLYNYLVVREPSGIDRPWFVRRVQSAAETKEELWASHRTLAKRYREIHGRDPVVVGAGEMMLNSSGHQVQIIPSSGGWRVGNTSAEYASHLFDSYGLARTNRTQVMHVEPGTDPLMGHMKAKEFVRAQKYLDEKYPGFTDDTMKLFRDFTARYPEVREIYPKPGGLETDIDYNFARKFVRFSNDRSFSPEKREAYSEIKNLFQLEKDTSLNAAIKTVERYEGRTTSVVEVTGKTAENLAAMQRKLDQATYSRALQDLVTPETMEVAARRVKLMQKYMGEFVEEFAAKNPK